MPTITIPAAEVGTLVAVSVVRQGDLLIDGQVAPNQTVFLPAERDAKGNVVFVDYWMPYAPPTAAPEALGRDRLWRQAQGLVNRGLLLQVSAQASKPKGEAVYKVATYQDHINWKTKPLLVRMVPDASAKPPNVCR